MATQENSSTINAHIPEESAGREKMKRQHKQFEKVESFRGCAAAVILSFGSCLRFTVGEKRQCGLLNAQTFSGVRYSSYFSSARWLYRKERRKPFRDEAENTEKEMFSDDIWKQLSHLASSRAEMSSGGKGTSNESRLSHMRVCLCVCLTTPPTQT